MISDLIGVKHNNMFSAHISLLGASGCSCFLSIVVSVRGFQVGLD